MSSIYRRLVKELALARCRNLGGALPQSAAEHRHILKAIGSGDAEGAGRVLFEHAEQSKQRMLRNEAPTVPLRARGGRQDV